MGVRVVGGTVGIGDTVRVGEGVGEGIGSSTVKLPVAACITL